MRRAIALGLLPLLAACATYVSPGEPAAEYRETTRTSPDRSRVAHASAGLPSDSAGVSGTWEGQISRLEPSGDPGVPFPEAARQADRIVIYNGHLTIQVPEPDELAKKIVLLAKGLGGWVQKLDGPRLTIRIPASRFEDAFSEISEMGQVLQRRIIGNDVTDQFRDLKLRLENAERLRTRLATILEQAKNVTDALAVEKEIARVTEDIERMKGALAQMQDQIAYSTLAVELVRSMPVRPTALGLPFPWVRELGVGRLLHFER